MLERAQHHAKLLLGPLAVLTLGFGIVAHAAGIETVSSDMSFGGFNPAMLSGSGDKIDVSRFTHGNSLSAGNYRVDVYINQEWLGRRDIDIKTQFADNESRPCITKTLLLQMGVNLAALPQIQENIALGSDETPGNACVDMALQLPHSTVEFDAAELRLNVSIPQLFLSRMSRGYVNESEWQQGINAGFLNYSINSTSSSNAQLGDRLFAGLNFGANLEGWRIRYNGSYTNNFNVTGFGTTQVVGTSAGAVEAGSQPLSAPVLGLTNTVQQTSHWQQLSAYAQHDITSLKSQLTVGDAYTSGDMFNSVSLQGVMLASDDRMLPQSQRGYAPVIRGIAETNARVTVRQGGNIIYETTVPPGEFKIDDMYNSSFAGDFLVTLVEADGRQKQFVVPYSAGVLLLRPGAYRYSVAAGKLLNVTTTNAPAFIQGTLQHGIGQGITVYGGAIAAEYYGAALVGVARSTIWGAFGLDLTRSQARSAPRDTTLPGSSLRLSYSKIMEQTGTNFSLAAYSYSTSDYLTLSDAALLRDQHSVPGAAVPASALVSAPFLSPRKSFQIALTQPLSEKFGSVYISGIAQYYWNGAPNAISYQAGYSNNASWGNYGLSLSRTIDALGNYHNLASVSINIPIGNEGAMRRAALTGSMSYGDQQTTTQLALNGALDDNGKITYNAYDNHASSNSSQNPATSSAGIGAQFSGSAGQLWASYSSGTTRQTTLNASGALLLHSGGILLAPNLGETIGIVYAPGAEGASVMNSNYNRIGASGYSVIPFLTPYMNNDIVIDPKGSNMNAELETTSQQIAPRAGAIVLLKFSTTIGRAILMTVTRTDGNSLPIGSGVFDENGKEIGMLAQGQRFFNRSLGSKGRLLVKWGEEHDQHCLAAYTLPKETTTASTLPYEQLSVSCTPNQD